MIMWGETVVGRQSSVFRKVLVSSPF